MKKFTIFTAILLGFIIILPLFAPFDPNEVNLNSIKLAPNLKNILGTDFLGRDELSRLLFAFRNSIFIGLLSGVFAIIFAFTFAFLALNSPKIVKTFLMRFLDAFLSLPNLLLILLFSAFSDKGFNIFTISLLLAIFSFGSATKVIHDEFLSISKNEYILNAKALGAGRLEIMFCEILPVAKNSVFVIFINICAHAISTEALLSFFGLGLMVGEASLGNMLNEAAKAIFAGAWWLVLTPGLAIFVTVLSLMLVGERVQKDD
ncbi:ABC transporter permease [Campylobacter fetus]|uniref:ABC transporter permease n=1 Tax=Campylobacter fetus TaxID=196 RepID=UPI000818B555|nr:ABC transporter permease [Campylobacter fetus]OCR85047.1 peptide ABC transporter permease [Campylobacter fetus subsp. testudinum]